ncbi:hypothetical protein R3P38DRAFT_3040316, partial [Favolaschia claudopus]
MASTNSLKPRDRRRFSLLDMMRSAPRYHCEKCSTTVRDISQWMEHLGHDPVTDAIVLGRMDPWVNEHALPEENIEDEPAYLETQVPPSSEGRSRSRPASLYSVGSSSARNRLARSRSSSLGSWLKGAGTEPTKPVTI